MSEEQEVNIMLLKAVVEEYAVPDPKIVGTIQRSGVDLSFIGHADITRILLDVDPMWSWEPIEWVNGQPAIHVENGIATMWGRLTLLGKTMICVGSAKADKAEYAKEIVGDLIRNGSMRFGIGISLWSKQDWDQPRPQSSQTRQSAPINTVKLVTDAFNGSAVSTTGKPFVARQATPASTGPKQASASNPISEKQVGFINKLCKEAGITNIVEYATHVVQRDVPAINQLNSKEASTLIDRLMNPHAVAPVASVPAPPILDDEEPF